MTSDDTWDDNEHDYCEQCGDCIMCDTEHYCKVCNDCSWRCECEDDE